MKSVTVLDYSGNVLIRVTEHKGGGYTLIRNRYCAQVHVEARDDKNRKVKFHEKAKDQQGKAG